MEKCFDLKEIVNEIYEDVRKKAASIVVSGQDVQPMLFVCTQGVKSFQIGIMNLSQLPKEQICALVDEVSNRPEVLFTMQVHEAWMYAGGPKDETVRALTARTINVSDLPDKQEGIFFIVAGHGISGSTICLIDRKANTVENNPLQFADGKNNVIAGRLVPNVRPRTRFS